MCYNKCLTAHQGLLDQSIAQEFIKYIRQQSLAPLLRFALVRRRCYSHCNSCMGWSRISSPMISAVYPDDISCIISAVACVICPEIFARTAAGLIIWTAAEDFSQVHLGPELLYQFMWGWGLHLHLQEILFQTLMIFQTFLVSCRWLSLLWINLPKQCEKFGCSSAASYYYVTLCIRSSLLLIIDLGLMSNNDVIMKFHYYIFLCIIDLCTKM